MNKETQTLFAYILASDALVRTINVILKDLGEHKQTLNRQTLNTTEASIEDYIECRRAVDELLSKGININHEHNNNNNNNN